MVKGEYIYLYVFVLWYQEWNQVFNMLGKCSVIVLYYIK